MQRKSIEALHIAGAAPEKLALTLGHSPRIRCPILTCDRHNIGMPGQNHTARNIGSDRAEDRMFGRFIRLHKAVGLDAKPSQIRLDPINERNVGVVADGRKGHKRIKYLARG